MEFRWKKRTLIIMFLNAVISTGYSYNSPHNNPISSRSDSVVGRAHVPETNGHLTRRIILKQLILLIAMLLVFPVAFADQDKNRAGAVVVVDAYGDTVGRVVNFWTQGAARIFMQIDGKDAIVWLNLGGLGVSSPVDGPRLFFEGSECDGQAYARPDHVGGGWLQPRVVIVPGFVPEGSDPSFERIAYYSVAPGPSLHSPQSHLSSEGYCLDFEPPEADVWPVRILKACRFSYDLHTCYPPPYELAR